jgi:hypothetical protein
MATTYQQVIDKAEIILQDEDSDQTTRRWTEDEMLGWVADGELEIARLKPDSYPVIEAVQLAAGSQQSLPSRAVMLLDVLSNMGTNGTTRGNIIDIVEKSIMNALNPGWMSDTANTVVTHVIYDTKRAPKLFWVYPKSDGTNYIELMTGKLPDNGSKVIGDAILLDDEYATALMHYCLALCFSKDTDIAESVARSRGHYTIFLNQLGRKEQAEAIFGPMKSRETE